MRVTDGIAIATASYWSILALVRRPGRRAAVLMTAAAVIASVAAFGASEPGAVAAVTRDWVPALYILANYWISGAFFQVPDRRLERRLLAFDRNWLRAPLAWLETAPRPLAEALEAAYLLCIPIVPGGYATLVLLGHGEGADAYWSLVLLAEFGAFAPLPFLPTRPPRDLEPPGPLARRELLFRRLNELVVRNATIRVNTLPSGHAAGSTAVALAVFSAHPPAGPAFAAIAFGIIAGSVLGRYHYALDAVAGVLLSLLCWALFRVLA
jgi:hypothetical protein